MLSRALIELPARDNIIGVMHYSMKRKPGRERAGCVVASGGEEAAPWSGQVWPYGSWLLHRRPTQAVAEADRRSARM